MDREIRNSLSQSPTPLHMSLIKWTLETRFLQRNKMDKFWGFVVVVVVFNKPGTYTLTPLTKFPTFS